MNRLQYSDPEAPKDGESLKYFCYLCRDSGAVLAELVRAPGIPYAFNCSCKKAKWTGRNYPLWLNADHKKFQLIPEVRS